MNANEARLFTLEARLRSEENSRIKSFNFISKLIENLRNPLDKIQTHKRETPEGLYNVEILRKLGETEKRSVDYRENYSSLMESHDEGIEVLKRHFRTPKSNDTVAEFSIREARTSSVMGKRVLRKNLNNSLAV